MAQTRFKFTGTPSFPKADSKRPFYTKATAKTGNKYVKMNLGIKENDHNMGFVEAFGSIQKEIMTMNADNEKISIEWDNRFDDEVVRSVANYRKFVIDLGDGFERKEFISSYDALEYLYENLPKYKGKVTVTGQMRKDFYQDKCYDHFEFQNVYAVAEDTKSKLTITADIAYNKDCIDKADFKSEKVIGLDGYVQQYINKEEGTKWVPHRFVFNASKLDETNEKHQKLLEYKLKYLDVSAKKFGHLMWECVLINGAETVEFDISQLTQAQREQVDLGLKKVEDFRPNGSIFGERVLEYRLVDPKLTQDFSDGFVDLELSEKEFMEEVYIPVADESLDEVVAKAEKKVTKEEPKKDFMPEPEDEDIDEDDLFS